MSNLTFRIARRDNNGRGAIGKLEWDDDRYDSVSGPYGLGAAPVGNYEVRKRHVVSGPDLDTAYCVSDESGKLCFFIPLLPKFDTSRTGFGIHPDGNVPGSEGCIVLRPNTARAFWDKWMATSMQDRPENLVVVESTRQAKKKPRVASGSKQRRVSRSARLKSGSTRRRS